MAKLKAVVVLVSAVIGGVVGFFYGTNQTGNGLYLVYGALLGAVAGELICNIAQN